MISIIVEPEHPRVRGENKLMCLTWIGSLGTSPRARGKPAPAAWPRLAARNIPACAGKTSEHLSENYMLDGTSPRARGKHIAGFSFHDRFRNIPACAGKTVCAISSSRQKWEHPRVRGENSSVVVAWAEVSGTSPRARGKRAYICAIFARTRNIPACAGKTTPGQLHSAV